MATVMSWHNSEGCKGRCDAKCHNAETPECNCMCGGAYHGSKRKGTFDKIQAVHAEFIIKEATKRAAGLGFEIEFTEHAQPTLFGFIDS